MQKDFNFKIGEVVFCPRSRSYRQITGVDADGLPIVEKIFAEKLSTRERDKSQRKTSCDSKKKKGKKIAS